MKHCQIFSIELVSSILLYTLLFLVVLVIWSSESANLERNKLLYDLEIHAANIGELLVESPGYPKDWTIFNVEQLGLADNYHVINLQKIIKFLLLLNTNYDYTRELLGIPAYDLIFVIEDFNETVLYSFGSTNTNDIVVWKENVLLNNDVVRLKVGVAR